MMGCAFTGLLPRRSRAQTPDPSSGEAIVELAAKIADAAVPYRRGGRDRKGFDCSGLVWYVHHKVGVEVPRRAEEQAAMAVPVNLGDLSPGDLLFFRMRHTRHVDHVGIYIGPDRLIHASLHHRAVAYARLDDKYFLPRVVSAGRLWATVVGAPLPAPLEEDPSRGLF
jgi:cell wall-associated NlpC family hydrolase